MAGTASKREDRRSVRSTLSKADYVASLVALVVVTMDRDLLAVALVGASRKRSQEVLSGSHSRKSGTTRH